jgi:hypothetical protein
MRFSPVDIVAGKLINFYAGDDAQKHQLGARSSVVSSDYSTTANVGNGGGGEVQYVRAAGTFGVGRLVVIDKDWIISDLPVTANTGRPLAVCLSQFTAAAPFGWVMLSGVCPVSFAVAATVGPVFGGTAGQATPTAAAGRQILGAHCLIAAAGTFTKAGRTRVGQPFIDLTGDVSGIYPGMAVSGTGVPGGATVLNIDPDGRRFTLSANATASGSPTLTFTHTNFGICQVRYPFIQGQIT